MSGNESGLSGSHKADFASSGDLIKRDNQIILSSSTSTRISLEAVKKGDHGLDRRRQALLSKVPHSGMWIEVEANTLKMIDLAYLSAKTGHEFAILRSKRKDILYHGTSTDCNVLSDSQLQKDLLDQKLKLFGHSHLAELIPEPSNNDRKFLWFIEQKESFVISAMTGICIQYQAL